MCPEETKLLRFLAGELPEGERELVLLHLGECESCRALRQSLQGAWDELGRWKLVIPPVDLTAAVLSSARRESARGRWFARSGIAAAILVAAGIGWTLGRLPGKESVLSGGTVTAEEMVKAVGLDALEGNLGAFSMIFAEDESEAGLPRGGQL